MDIIVKNHERLHRSVIRALLAGGAASLLSLFVPKSVTVATSTLLIGVAIVPPTSLADAAVALLFACLGGGLSRLGGTLGTVGATLGIGLELSRGRSGLRWLWSLTLGLLGGSSAELLTRAFAETEVFSFLAVGPAALVGGAMTGGVVGLFSIGREFEFASSLENRHRPELEGDGELAELLMKAERVHREAVAVLERDAPEAKRAVDDLLVKMAGFGRRWAEVEREAARSSVEELRARRQRFDAQLETADEDPATRFELERARQAVDAQLDCLAEIDRGRTRALARLQHQVATLERLRLAAVRHRSADATRLGTELAPLVEELTEAGADLHIAAEALSEAHLASAPTLQKAVRPLS